MFIYYIIYVEWNYFNVRERGAKATVKVARRALITRLNDIFVFIVLAMISPIIFIRSLLPIFLKRRKKKSWKPPRPFPTPCSPKVAARNARIEGVKPRGLSSFITRKRFKRSECQLVNIIIMTSNMGRSLHRVTRAAPERPEYRQGGRPWNYCPVGAKPRTTGATISHRQ